MVSFLFGGSYWTIASLLRKKGTHTSMSFLFLLRDPAGSIPR